MEIAEYGIKHIKEDNDDIVFHDILKKEIGKEEPTEIDPPSKYDVCDENHLDQEQDSWNNSYIESEEVKPEVEQFNRIFILKNAYEENSESSDDLPANDEGLKTELFETEGDDDIFEDYKRGIREEKYIGSATKIEPIPSSEESRIEQEHIVLPEEHKRKTDNDSKREPIICKICSKSFKRKFNLKEHEKIHTGEKPFKCNSCSKSFSVKSSLLLHEKIHTGEKPFDCELCSKAFVQKKLLLQHQRVHTGEKPFECNSCSKSFTVKSSLLLHEKNHKGEKPFICKICSKPFVRKSSLLKHQLIHTGERPFRCKSCSKSYRKKWDLLLHERIHIGEKPFKCEFCIESFSQNDHLLEHERSHIREEQFKCNLCSELYKKTWIVAGCQKSHQCM